MLRQENTSYEDATKTSPVYLIIFWNTHRCVQVFYNSCTVYNYNQLLGHEDQQLKLIHDSNPHLYTIHAHALMDKTDKD